MTPIDPPGYWNKTRHPLFWMALLVLLLAGLWLLSKLKATRSTLNKKA